MRATTEQRFREVAEKLLHPGEVIEMVGRATPGQTPGKAMLASAARTGGLLISVPRRCGIALTDRRVIAFEEDMMGKPKPNLLGEMERAATKIVGTGDGFPHSWVDLDAEGNPAPLRLSFPWADRRFKEAFVQSLSAGS